MNTENEVHSAPPAPKTTLESLRARAKRLETNRQAPPATLAEAFSAAPTDGAATGFVLASLARIQKPILWIQDHLSRRECGQPYFHGLKCETGKIFYLELSRASDVLRAAEEGLRCHSLGAVIAEIWGNPKALDFTATKRLALRAEAQRVPGWLLRHVAQADLSAARERWRIETLPSRRHPYDMRAPGTPVWRAHLFRARWRPTGEWIARVEHGTLHLEHAAEQNTTIHPNPIANVS